MRFQQVLDVCRAVRERNHDIDIPRVLARGSDRHAQTVVGVIVRFTALDGGFHRGNRFIHRLRSLHGPGRKLRHQLTQRLDVIERDIDLVLRHVDQ